MADRSDRDHPSREHKTTIVLETRIQELRARKEELETVVSFKVGQILRWKQGLRNRLVPDYHEPVIVMRVLEKPCTHPTDDVGSPYFREQLDVVLGLIVEDGFLEYLFDGRRFELHPGASPVNERDSNP